MNSCEDQTEPLGEAPEVHPGLKHPPVRVNTYYEAQCTTCGTQLGHEWQERDESIEHAVRHGWLRRDPELLCPDCFPCEVCGAEADVIDGHLLCPDHEGQQALFGASA